MAEIRLPRLAVLIDADNASAKIVDRLFVEIAKFGEANVRRIYGDFAGARLRPWADVLARYAIMPHQQFAYTSGKNASDIALVIDAMDLLYSGKVDGFCLVSSDSDFTRLASRLRDDNVAVFGFGERKTPESFVRACKRFIYAENLGERPAGAAAERKPRELLSEAAELLVRVIGEAEGEDGWANLAAVGSRLSALASDFDSRTYGFKKLGGLVRAVETLELTSENGQQRVRIRPKAAKPPAAGTARG